MRRNVAVFVSALSGIGLTLSGCGGADNNDGRSDASAFTGADTKSERGDVPVACTGPLEDRWGLCPATFDGHLETFGCRSAGIKLYGCAAVIDGRQVIEWSNFPVMVRCVYASVTVGADLVGEINIADSLLFCDRKSYSRAFGSVPESSLGELCTTPKVYTCPLDAGV